jgi:hypothetical protein
MAFYDMPAFIEKIKDLSNVNDVAVMGHSFAGRMML